MADVDVTTNWLCESCGAVTWSDDPSHAGGCPGTRTLADGTVWSWDGRLLYDPADGDDDE